MNPDPTISTIRQASAVHALAFGSLLLRRAGEGQVTLRHFVDTAADFVHVNPAAAGEYLAFLVALDMRRETLDGGR